MVRRLLLIWVVVLVRNGASAGLAAPVLICGKVVDEGGASVHGARVEVFRTETVDFKVKDILTTSVTVDESGQYETGSDGYGFCPVRVSAPGYVPCRAMSFPNRRTKKMRTDVLNFVLKRGCILAGRLLDEAGRPVAGARLRSRVLVAPEQLVSSGRYPAGNETVSAGDGTFQFDDAATGPMELTVMPADLVPGVFKLNAPTATASVRLNSLGGEIQGRVTLLSDGKAVPGASVHLFSVDTDVCDRVTSSDARGLFRFDRLSSATYAIQAEVDGLGLFDPRMPQGGGNRDKDIALRAGEKIQALELRLYPGHVLRGRVTNRETGRPVSGLEIRTFLCPHTQPLKAVTDAVGRYEIRGLFVDFRDPEIRLWMDDPELEYAREDPRSIRYPSARANPQQHTLWYDFRMTSSTQVTGKLRNEQGCPIGDARLYLIAVASRAPEEPEADGSFHLPATPGETVQVKAMAPGYAPAFSHRITPLLWEPARVDLVLTRGLCLSGRVTDTSGAGVGGAYVSADIVLERTSGTRHESIATTTTQADGAFSLPNLPAAKISFHIFHERYQQKLFIRDLSGKERLGPEIIVLEPKNSSDKTQSAAGVVVDPDGKPIAGCQVSTLALDTVSRQSVTDSGGLFRIESIGRKKTSVMLRWNGAGITAVVEPGREDHRLVFNHMITLSGTVLDAATSAPVSGFEFECCEGYKAQGSGSFQLRIPRCEYMSYVLKAPGYLPNSGTCRMSSYAKTAAWTFFLGRGGTISGRAIRKSTGQPIVGCEIGVSPRPDTPSPSGGGEKPYLTGLDGTFRITGVMPGRAEVFAMPEPPLLAASQTVGVSHNAETSVTFALHSGLTLRGSVVRMPGSVPLPGQKVVVYPGPGDSSGTVLTDAQGRFSFSGLRDGSYGVRLPQLLMESHLIPMQDDAELTVPVGKSRLKFSVAGPPGQKVVVRLYPYYWGPVTHAAELNTNATAVLEGIEAGGWTVTLGKPDEDGRIEETLIFKEGLDIEREYRLIEAEPPSHPGMGVSSASPPAMPGAGWPRAMPGCPSLARRPAEQDAAQPGKQSANQSTSSTAQITTETYNLAPLASFPRKTAQVLKMADCTVEVIKGMLYSKTAESTVGVGGRDYVYDRENLLLTLHDTRENLWAIGSYLASLDGPALPPSNPVMFGQLSAADELCLRDLTVHVSRFNREYSDAGTTETVEIAVRTPSSSKDLALRKGESELVDDYLVTVIHIEKSDQGDSAIIRAEFHPVNPPVRDMTAGEPVPPR